MTAYYNEIDPYVAEWLRRLILQGHIAHGDVDERSIEDVTPDDLRGYTQCHFFAGIGVWSHALRAAGFADDRQVWTGSCPCQPFSAAGKGAGFADERHLWPAFLHLIRECRPELVLGEQVASKDGLGWLDLVQADLEGEGYASWAADTCAAGFGAPHIRQRLYWGARPVAHANSAGQRALAGELGQPRRGSADHADSPGGISGLANTDADRCCQGAQREFHDAEHNAEPRGRSGGLAEPHDTERRADLSRGHDGHGDQAGRDEDAGHADPGRGVLRLGDADGDRPGQEERSLSEPGARQAYGSGLRPNPTNGFWRGVDWLFCRDDRWRPVEPGTFPLVASAPSRVGRLRAYGNAICAAQAQGFIEAVMGERP